MDMVATMAQPVSNGRLNGGGEMGVERLMAGATKRVIAKRSATNPMVPSSAQY